MTSRKKRPRDANQLAKGGRNGPRSRGHLDASKT